VECAAEIAHTTTMAGTALDMASSDEEELAPVVHNAAAAVNFSDEDSDLDESDDDEGLTAGERAVLQGGRKRPRAKKPRKPKAKKPRTNRADKYITMEAEEEDDDGAMKRRSRSDMQEAAAAEAAADKVRRGAGRSSLACGTRVTAVVHRFEPNSKCGRRTR
jgi:hypothetical protein